MLINYECKKTNKYIFWWHEYGRRLFCVKDNQYIYAENIRILTNEGSSFAAMQNIEGFLACRPSSNLSGETIIHVTTIRDWAIVFTKINGTNNNNVYRIDFSRSQEEPIVTK